MGKFPNKVIVFLSKDSKENLEKIWANKKIMEERNIEKFGMLKRKLMEIGIRKFMEYYKI